MLDGAVPYRAERELVEIVVMPGIAVRDQPVAMGLLVEDCDLLPKSTFGGDGGYRAVRVDEKLRDDFEGVRANDVRS